jgi:hypothetical protein
MSMSTIPLKNFLTEDLTPLDAYEFLGSYTKAPNFVAGAHHKIIDGVVLCQHPDNKDYGSSLESTVKCQYCRNYWSFRVNAESYRQLNLSGIGRNLFTKFHEMKSCHCTCCQEEFARLMRG